jgi:hypothetical protein
VTEVLQNEIMAENAIKKIYVNPDGKVTFICPRCGSAQRESVEKYKDHKGSIKVECTCMNVYEVKLELRKFYRKEIYLDGLYFRSSHSGDWGKMVVRNLSMEGCGFETMKMNSLLVTGEEIKVEFALDDRRNSTVRKKAIILKVEGRNVGCKFLDPPGSYNPELGFYLKQ